jgi:hypothetical protein
MARLTTPGIWLPGALNTINSPSPTSQADTAGNPYFMGLSAGKLVVLSTQEAQAQAATGTIVGGTQLYDGAYQYVQLDSGATAAYATAGNAAFLLLNQGLSEGTLPESAYQVPVVTTADIANTGGISALFCGVFINPVSVNGASTAPTPGNWTMIFAGGGRVAVQVGSVANVAVGNAVFPDTNHTGKFEGSAPTSGTVWGQAVSAGTSGGTAVAYYSDIILRFAQ